MLRFPSNREGHSVPSNVRIRARSFSWGDSVALLSRAQKRAFVIALAVVTIGVAAQVANAASNSAVSISAAHDGATITTTGRGFAPGTKATITTAFADQPAETQAAIQDNGEFVAHTTIPSGFSGLVVITAKGKAPRKILNLIPNGTKDVATKVDAKPSEDSSGDSSSTTSPPQSTATPNPSTTAPLSTPPSSVTTPPTAAPSSSADATPPPAPTGKRWNLAFSEEFNGAALDPTKLSPCFDWNYGACTSTFNNGRETYAPSQVQVSGGTAKLVAQPDATAGGTCRGGACTYKSGLVSTARPNASNGSDYLYSFTYGYVEANMTLPSKKGFFTAFWMLPADPSYNYRSEIDILEHLGNKTPGMFMTYHYANRSQSHALNSSNTNNGACAVLDYSQGFHRVGVDWQSDHIAWYIDGTKCGEFTDANSVEHGPMQIILNVMVDNDWQRSWNIGLDDPTLTDQLEVDYLRVYQLTN